MKEIVYLSGYITQVKYVQGRRLGELERILGFHRGRFANGVKVAVLKLLPGVNDFNFSSGNNDFDLLPGMDDFELRGYTQVPEHLFQEKFGDSLFELDVEKLKLMAINNWSSHGPNRLVKILPYIPHPE